MNTTTNAIGEINMLYLKQLSFVNELLSLFDLIMSTPSQQNSSYVRKSFPGLN